MDSSRFHPGRTSSGTSGPLQLLFVGTINQRKGIYYLLEALRSFSERDVCLKVCGRVVDDLRLFKPFGSQVQIRPSVAHDELVEAYQSSDLLVFPSVAEGFGHVILESLACGLPVLSTRHTAAPDLIEEGADGFVVDPRSVSQLVSKIVWALSHRKELRLMREAARTKGAAFTWHRFRDGVQTVVSRCLDGKGRGCA